MVNLSNFYFFNLEITFMIVIFHLEENYGCTSEIEQWIPNNFILFLKAVDGEYNIYIQFETT